MDDWDENGREYFKFPFLVVSSFFSLLNKGGVNKKTTLAAKKCVKKKKKRALYIMEKEIHFSMGTAIIFKFSHILPKIHILAKM